MSTQNLHNLQVRLAARPRGLPRESDFELVEEPCQPPAEGEVLVKVAYLSLDPAARGWMDDRRSYIPPVAIGEVMRGLAAGEVVESRHPRFQAGDRVTGALGWQRFARVAARELTALPATASYLDALGPLGMVGMTAYFGLLDVGRPQENDTVLVSGGAGAVGSLVGQIAKLHGCRAVGIAGSDDKCRWLTEELGLDGAINYKTAGDLDAAIRDACPDGVDVYFDNVGGAVLDAALRRINRGARVVICGAISQYNATEPIAGPSNYLMLLVQRARMEGFVVLDYVPRFAEALGPMARWLAEGKLKARFDVVDGLENAPRALLKLFDGSNTGKLVVRVGEE
ncbi:MAG: NADP-dependent oxidoreductase [Acidobacteria bacterium]|nr:MAG: NADP-dependent oxidoreductase [Acidobacteriota bacterium]